MSKPPTLELSDTDLREATFGTTYTPADELRRTRLRVLIEAERRTAVARIQPFIDELVEIEMRSHPYMIIPYRHR